MRVVPPVKAIVYFDAVARLLSFKLAAEELCVTPGAISHQINILEDFIGQKLFIRMNRTIQLTNAGLRYFARTTFILDELEQASIDLGKQSKAKIIKIAVPPALLNHWLIPQLNVNQYSKKGISIEFIELMDSDTKLIKNNIDIAIYYGLQQPKSVYAKELFKEDMIVVCSPALTNLYPLETDLAKYLLSTPLIYTTNRLIQWDAVLHQYQINPLNISKKIVFQNSIPAITAALNGIGLALINKMLVQSLLNANQLIEPFKLAQRVQKIPAYYLTCSLEKIHDPLIQYCIEDINRLSLAHQQNN